MARRRSRGEGRRAPTQGASGHPSRKSRSAGARVTATSKGLPVWVPALCLLVSGVGSLVLEVSWTRHLRLVFGSSTPAVTTVLVAYMLGLGLGALLGARWVRRVAHPLRAYALLEVAIGLYAFAAPDLLGLLAHAEAAGLYALTPATGIALRFALTLSVLLVPTLAMGATLPLMVAAIEARSGKAGRTVGLLYGVNTVGAMLGVMGATFVLLPRLGLWATNASGAGLDLLAGGLAGAVAITFTAPGPPAPANAAEPVSGPSVPSVPARRRSALVLSYGVVGFTALVAQVCWSRALSMVIGSSIYAFAAMLGAFLLGIALGSLAVRRRCETWDRPERLYALGLGAFGALSFAVLLLLPRVPELFLALAVRSDQSPAAMVAIQFSMAVGVMLPSTLVLGALFPLLCQALARGGSSAADAVGRVYLANSAGSATGALVAGFLGIPLLGIGTTLALASALNLVVSAALVRPWRATTRPALRLAAGLAAASAFAVAALPPDGGRLTALTQGVFRDPKSSFDVGVSPLPYEGATPDRLLFYRDGLHTTVSVHVSGGVRSLRVNGKPDASNSPADMPTQVLLGQIPFLFGPRAERAAIIGYASGVTVGSVARRPLDRIDAIELEPAMFEASRLFDRESGAPLRDARVRAVVQDGRTHLAYTPERYDVIISEPSNPWISGVANLFTREFFVAARRALAPGGRLVQWLQVYDLDADTLGSVLAALHSQFDYVYGFRFSHRAGDLILLAQQSPLRAGDFPRWRSLSPAVRRDLERIGVEGDAELWSLLRLSPTSMRRLAATPGIENSDDNLYLELRAPFLLYEDPERSAVDALGDARAHAVSVLAEAGYTPSPSELGALAFAYARHRLDPDTARLLIDLGRERGAADAMAAARSALSSFQEEAEGAREHMEAILSAAIERNPADALARWERGRRRAQRGDLAGALADSEAALAARPSSRLRRFHAERLLEAGRAEDAHRAIEALLVPPEGEHSEALRELRARIAEALGDYGRGAALREELVLRAPSLAGFEALASLWERAGSPEDLARARRNVEIAERNLVLNLHVMARRRALHGRRGEAREALALALALDPAYEPAERDLRSLDEGRRILVD